MYCGCNTCCSKFTWCLSVLLLLASAAALAAGLYVTVPCARTLTVCYKSPEANTSVNQCWNQFWQCTKSGKAGGLYFFLAVAGAACFFLSLLTCSSFCCMKSPRAKARAKAEKQAQKDQFIQSNPTDAPAQQATDTATYSDQYAAYGNYPNAKTSSVAHV